MPVPTTSRNAAAARWGVGDLRKRPGVIVNGLSIYEIKVFDDEHTVIVGDGAFIFEIPEDLDGSTLVKVEGYVTTVSSSGALEISLLNQTTGFGMLSTHLTIDASELNSKTAAIPTVIDPAHADVSWGDHIAINIIAAGTGAIGLGMILVFAPSDLASVAIQGAKGDPGGITSWQGEWSSGTAYSANQAVSHNGSSYVAITSSTAIEPGVTSGWQTYWMLLASGASGSVGTDGWTSDTSTTWTYVSSTSFKVSGSDVTARFPKGTRLRLKQGAGYKYFIVTASSFSTDTTVTITGGSDYSLANASITDNYYSYQASPQGYPDWFNYTPANVTGWSGSPFLTARFRVLGRTCLLTVIGDGTSNSTSTQFDAPIATTDTNLYFSTIVRNNGTFAQGRYFFNTSTQLLFNANITGGAWTASGQKTVSFFLEYIF